MQIDHSAFCILHSAFCILHMVIHFTLLHTDHAARLGRLETPHGIVSTPVFMAVGTQGTVKGLTPAQLREAGVQVILGNTYHLALRPGDEVIAQLGGLHRFSGWDGPILTDSGGYQIYSLALSRRIDDRAAVFQSHIDGARLELSPEKAVAIQENLGSDIAMCLDECPPFGTPLDYLRVAVQRTIHWAERCRTAHHRTNQALFAIVQGGMDLELRVRCAEALEQLDFPGYALGGFSVGETPEQMQAALTPTAAVLPDDRPRYLMGVGRPQDILAGIAAGIDLFDCVLPTRNGRNAQAFTAGGVLPSQCLLSARFGSAGVRLFLSDVQEVQSGLPAPPVPGQGDVGTNAAVAAQRGFLLPVAGGGPAGDPGRTVRGFPRGQPCPLGSRRLKYPFCPFTEGLGDNSRNDARARRAKIRQASANPL